ncbi:MAG: LptF/LptG family permease [bacterium]
MKLLSKYLLITIIRPFIITLILTNCLFLIGYAFSSLEFFLTYKPGLIVILKYICLNIPQNLLFTFPISGIISILSLGTRIITKGELRLLLSSGVSKMAVVLPVICLFFLLSLILLCFSEFLIPQSNRSHTILKKGIKGIVSEEKPISLKLSNAFVHIGFLEKNTIRSLKIQRQDLIISAKICEYRNKKWHLTDGIEREIERGEVKRETNIPILNFCLPKPEEIMLFVESNDELMKPSMLFKAIGIAKRYGMSDKNYIKKLHFKIAFSFSSLVLAMIGLGMLTSGLKFGLYGNIGIALLISFIYWEGMLFFSQMDISPFLCSWAANIIGISIAFKLLSK